MSLKTLAYISFIFATFIAFWFLISGDYMRGRWIPNIDKIKEIHPFMTGIVLPLLTFGSTILVIENLRSNTLQNFSNNFFKLIDQNRKILEGVNCETSHLLARDIKSKGKDFFDDLADKIADEYDIISKKTNARALRKINAGLLAAAGNKQGKELLVIIYDHYFHIHHSDIGHYFRNLYYIVKYVDKAKIQREEKKDSLKILRSQLSNYELLILAYNGMHPYGKEFYPFIDSYELLKSLNNETKVPAIYRKRIIDISILKEAYPHLNNLWKDAN
jgi:hypothetical protein